MNYDHRAMPAWPDPHEGLDEPRDDGYSLVTEPERYRIVHARARAWATSLGRLPGIDVETLAPGPIDEEGHLGPFDRGVRLTPRRLGTLPLVLLERDACPPGHGAPLPVLHISVVQPDVTLEMIPDCGCDACDRGSADLLHVIDEAIAHIVGGPFVALRGKGWQAQWHPGGGSSGGAGRGPQHARVMKWCNQLARGDEVRLPRGAEAFVGRSWLGEPL